MATLKRKYDSPYFADWPDYEITVHDLRTGYHGYDASLRADNKIVSESHNRRNGPYTIGYGHREVAVSPEILAMKPGDELEVTAIWVLE